MQYHFFDGAVIPIGLGLSLILNGIFFAAKINSETNCLTLPDVFAKRYGRIVEVLVSITTITSFLMLLAGNLVGMGVITSYLWGISEGVGIWITAIIVWAYAVSGGPFARCTSLIELDTVFKTNLICVPVTANVLQDSFRLLTLMSFKAWLDGRLQLIV